MSWCCAIQQVDGLTNSPTWCPQITADDPYLIWSLGTDGLRANRMHMTTGMHHFQKHKTDGNLGLRERHMGHVALAECINLPLQEGMAFELNNVLPHAVRNEGPGMRVHLLIDVSKHHYTNVTPLHRGEVCSYEKGMSNCGKKQQWSLW